MTKVFAGVFGGWLRSKAATRARTDNGKSEIQGSLHCATDGETVRCFGRDDVGFGVG